jgi:protein-L-isoaspartate(D-aspartate) O-methyltransferase
MTGDAMHHDPRFDRERHALWEILRSRGITDERVLSALNAVPREEFVPRELWDRAYENSALPIEAGQTISQPLMVASMTQELQLTGDERVLEVGTGSGYQTAVLAELARHVVTIERIESLAVGARGRLEELGCTNIEFHVGDGSLGWPQSAPYDAILVTAGAPRHPAPLYNQLEMGGRLVVPVGDETTQTLQVVSKTEHGPRIRDAGGCRFVRLIGEAGWSSDPPAVEELFTKTEARPRG